MCGIAGYLGSAVRDGAAMVRALRHRGPDANGCHEAIVADRQVFLGHSRLSIIDLSEAGNQPMSAAAGDIVLVFNGEIYNFFDLRERHLRDVPLRSRTDTEVVLRLYEQRGLSFLDEINGDFAMAILDKRIGHLYLIRDRAGVKPLYYTQVDGGLAFASEVKALAAGGVRLDLDHEGLQRFFVFKYTPGTETLFRGIRRLPPGHVLDCDIASGRTQMRPYWHPDFGRRSALDYREAQFELHRLLADATRLRLISDVPVGTFLSGGLDSSIIASFLRGNDRITHYCARQRAEDTGPEGTTTDFPYAQRLANDWGLRLVPVETGAANLTPEQIRTTVRYGDDLIADAAQIPSYLITRGAARTSRVFLSGMGADEIFLGYAGHQLSLMFSWLQKLPVPNSLFRHLGRIDQRRGAFRAYRRYLYRLGKYAGYPAWRYGVFSIIGDFEASAAVVSGDREALEGYLAGYFPEQADPFESFKRFEFENFLQKNLSYVDAMSMANSVEVRVPFLDHRIIEFAYSLPRQFKLGTFGKAKRILHDAFAADLPPYIVKRRKAGFGMPIRSLFSNPALVRDLLDVPALAGIAAFDIAHIEGLVDRHASGQEDNSPIIFALIVFQEWYRQQFSGQSAA